MQIKTTGLVIKQRDIGENDKILTILTKELGIVEATARGIKRSKNVLSAPCQILCYSEFCLYQGKSYYIVNSAEVINSFYDIRLDVVKLSLADYFCEITSFVSPDADIAWEYLRFFLNSLHFIEKDLLTLAQIKSIFELRALSLLGFMPDIVGCKGCSEFEKEKMFFLPLDGIWVCQDCADGYISTMKIPLTKPVLAAMRHIIYSQGEKVFSFKIGKQLQKQLSFITESFALIHTDANFKSLEIFKSLSLD
ncbi:MAG: DNA repair protein RecO [Oscillospiraceae bacterium]